MKNVIPRYQIAHARVERGGPPAHPLVRPISLKQGVMEYENSSISIMLSTNNFVLSLEKNPPLGFFHGSDGRFPASVDHVTPNVYWSQLRWRDRNHDERQIDIVVPNTNIRIGALRFDGVVPAMAYSVSVNVTVSVGRPPFAVVFTPANAIIELVSVV